MGFNAGDIEGRLTLDRSPFTEGLRQARADADAFAAKRITPTVDVTIGEAQRGLRELSAELDRIAQKHPSPEVRLKAAAAKAEADAFGAKLDTLAAKGVSIDADLKTAGFTAHEQELKAKIAELNAKSVNIDVDRGGLGRLNSLAGGLGLVGREAGNAEQGLNNFGRGANGAGGGADRAGVSFGGLASRMGLIVGAVVLLGPALLALSGSFAFAAAGAGALGTALVGSLAPALVLGLGLATRFTAIMQAKQAATTAANAATRGSVGASNQAAAAAEREYQAAIAVRDARQQLTAAHRAYAQAVLQAKTGIRDAFRSEADAAQAVKDAELSLTRASANLVTARRDAARAIADANQTAQDSYATLQAAAEAADRAQKQSAEDVASANLDAASAALDLRDANDAVAAAQLKVTQIQSGQRAATPRDLANAQEALARAQIGASRSAIALHDAQQRQTDTQKTANDFTTKGRDAYPPYVTALRAAHDATQKLNDLQKQGVAGAPSVISAVDAERGARERLARAKRDEADADQKLQLLRRQGISQNPGVIAANESLRNANERLTQAHHQASQAAQKNADATGAGAGAAALAAQKMAALSSAEREFLGVIHQVAHSFRETLQPATDAVFHAMSSGARMLVPAFRSLQPAFTQLGQAFGGVITGIAETLRNLTPEFDLLIRGTARLWAVGGKIFNDLLTIMMRIAVAAMPYLIRGFQDIERHLAGWVRHTQNARALSNTIGMLVGHLQSWLHLANGIGQVMLAFFRAVAPMGKSMVDTLAQGAFHLAAWIRSGPGLAAIRSFFSTTLPLVGQVARGIGSLVPLGAQILVAFAPVLTTVARLFNEILVPVIKFIATTPGFKQIAVAVTTVVFAVKALHSVWNTLLNAFNAVIGVAGSVVGAFTKAKEAVIALSVAVRANPFLAIAGAITAVVAGLVALSGHSQRAKISSQQLTDALKAQRDALQAVRDLDLDLADARTRTRSATLNVREAELALADLRQHGKRGTLEFKQAEVNLESARNEQKRATRDLSRQEQHGKDVRAEATTKTRDAITATKDRIATLEKEIAKEQVATHFLPPHSAALDHLHGKERELSATQAKLNELTQRSATLASEARGPLGGLASAVSSVGNTMRGAVGSITAVVTALSHIPTRATWGAGWSFSAGRQAGGLIPGYGGGDIVPSMLEPGEYVLRKEAVKTLGLGVVDALNAGGHPIPNAQVTVNNLPGKPAMSRVAQRAGQVVQNFIVPPSPAAHGQPEPRDTAAQISTLLRHAGGLP